MQRTDCARGVRQKSRAAEEQVEKGEEEVIGQREMLLRSRETNGSFYWRFCHLDIFIKYPWWFRW